MDTLWDKVKKNLGEWYVAAYDKTDELARIGKKKVEIVGVNRAIEKHLSELGGKVYDLIEEKKAKKPIAKDEHVLRLIEEIKDLERQLKVKEEEIEEIKREKRKDRSGENNQEE
ncbi:MAG: hypothetical protein JSV33_00965 [bacterium]|nr:MAG: hypothetical protein JSV33_00965 [bacterium]